MVVTELCTFLFFSLVLPRAYLPKLQEACDQR